MSEIIKVNQLIKKQKWKRIFVYLADLHSEMEILSENGNRDYIDSDTIMRIFLREGV